MNADLTGTGQLAVARALNIMKQTAPAPAVRAGAALTFLLAGVQNSAWPEVAWSFSRLTGDGFPVEFTFSSANNAIRYTTEIGGPEMNTLTRLHHAQQLLTHLGSPLPASVNDRLHAIQQAGSLQYGAWIGGRHDDAGDRYKVYSEVPGNGSAEASRLIRETVGEGTLLPDRPTQLCMIGFEPALSRIELYFRAYHLEPRHLHLLLRRARLASREAELLALIREAYGRPLLGMLPGAKCGFSYAIGQNGDAIVFSFFTFARSFFGGDYHIRRRLGALADRRGWEIEHYLEVSQPLADRTGWRTNHGGIALGVAADSPLFVSIGVQPPKVSE